MLLLLLIGEESGDATTTKLEDASRLAAGMLNNTFLLASSSEFDACTSAVYEISSVSSDAVVYHTDNPHIDEVALQLISVISTVTVAAAYMLLASVRTFVHYDTSMGTCQNFLWLSRNCRSYICTVAQDMYNMYFIQAYLEA